MRRLALPCSCCCRSWCPLAARAKGGIQGIEEEFKAGHREGLAGGRDLRAQRRRGRSCGAPRPASSSVATATCSPTATWDRCWRARAAQMRVAKLAGRGGRARARPRARRLRRRTRARRASRASDRHDAAAHPRAPRRRLPGVPASRHQRPPAGGGLHLRGGQRLRHGAGGAADAHGRRGGLADRPAGRRRGRRDRVPLHVRGREPRRQRRPLRRRRGPPRRHRLHLAAGRSRPSPTSSSARSSRWTASAPCTRICPRPGGCSARRPPRRGSAKASRALERVFRYMAGRAGPSRREPRGEAQAAPRRQGARAARPASTCRATSDPSAACWSTRRAGSSPASTTSRTRSS